MEEGRGILCCRDASQCGVKTSHLVDNTADKISIDCDWPMSTGNNTSVIFYKIDWIERLQTCF